MTRQVTAFRDFIIDINGWIIKKVFSKKSYESYARLSHGHPKFSFIGICLFYIVTYSFFVKIGYMVLKHYHKVHEHSVLEHIDIAGLLCGMLGINLSFLITRYVEEIHMEQNENMQKIIEQTNQEILGQLKSLRPLRSLSERMAVLDNIIQITKDSQKGSEKESHNSLYILDYGASYGHLQSFNTNLILREGKNGKKINTWHEYSNLHKEYLKMESDCFDKLLSLKGGTVNIALLRAKTDAYQIDKYEKLLKKAILDKKDRIIFPYFENDHNQFPIEVQNFIDKGAEVYTLPLANSEVVEYNKSKDKEKNQKKLKKRLIDKICDDNQKNIEDILKTFDESEYPPKRLVNTIAFLDYIPFQFFLTASNTSLNQKCLLIFINKEYDSRTVSYESDSPELIETLKTIYSTLAKNFLFKENERKKFLRIFNCNAISPCFVMKKIENSDKHVGENSPLAYFPDFVAYTDIKGLFSDFKIEATNVMFDVHAISGMNTEHGTYILIGLFKNKISEALKNLKNDGNDYFRCFTFSRDDIRDKDEIIKIAKYDKNKNLIKDENLWEQCERDPNNEYALIAKFEINGSTYIICGGLRSYGTVIIGRYIKENWAYIVDNVIGEGNLESKAFAVIFNIPIPLGKENIEDAYDLVSEGINVSSKFFLTAG